jgi:Flp pilus assembly protein TadD
MNLLGEVYLAQGRRDDAREHYASIVRANPRVSFAYDRLARLQVAAGDQAGALATLQTGVETTGRNPLLLQTLGLLQQDAGDLEAATAAYEEVLTKVPTAAVAANNLAMLIANRGTDDPARMARARALTEPFAESAQAGLVDTAGWVQYRSGNYGRAVELLEKAASLGVQSPEHQFHLGMAYLKVGRVDEGKALIAKAVEAGPAAFPGIDEARAILEEAP